MLAGILIAYLLLTLGIAIWARGKIHSAEDFIVAGRRLSFPLSTATLIATYVGAGTLLATTDEVRREGLRHTALEPIGPGVCLLLVGFFLARPLWEAKLLTHNDLYGRRFGRRAEGLSSLYAVSFFPWIAAQLLGVAGILTIYFDLSQTTGIVLTAAVALTYTLLGGMWSVALTDALQLVLVIAGTLILAVTVFAELGSGDPAAGIHTILSETPAEDLVVVPTANLRNLFHCLGLFLAGTIAIIPSQELMQRVFAARTARIASLSCLSAGLVYLAFGCLPVLLGLGSRFLLESGVEENVIATLAKALMNPATGAIFVLGVTSLVLSTLDSAILAPSSVLAQNLLRYMVGGRISLVSLTRLATIGVTFVSVLFALSGEDAFALLETSYSMGIALVLVLFFALYQKETHELPAVLLLLLGLVTWTLELTTGWTGLSARGIPVTDEEAAVIPVTLVTLVFGLALYLCTDRILSRRARRRKYARPDCSHPA